MHRCSVPDILGGYQNDLKEDEAIGFSEMLMKMLKLASSSTVNESSIADLYSSLRQEVFKKCSTSEHVPEWSPDMKKIKSSMTN
jgi:hypothetical protein